MYKIIAISKYGTEVVDTAYSRSEAESLVCEYQMAFGPGFTLYIKQSK